VCAYLSPSIFCGGSSPSAKPISSHTLCHIHVYIHIPNLPPTRQSSPSNYRRASDATTRILISFRIHPTTSSPTSLATKTTDIY
jgi:hypothetical protein